MINKVQMFLYVGKWNQAYQMDTLPIVLKQEELRPGDLIFYEGIYNNSTHRSKPQKHNNVHVEIFLGGETGAVGYTGGPSPTPE